MGALGENLFNQICGNTHGGRAEQPHQCRKPSCIAQNCPAHGAEVPDFMPTEVLGGPPGEVESRGRGRRCDAVHPRDLRPYVWGSHGYRGLALAQPMGPNAGWTPRRRLDDVFCGPFRRRRALRMWNFSTTRAKQNILVTTIRAPVCGPRAEQPESTLERARGKNNCPARVTSGTPKSTRNGPSFRASRAGRRGRGEAKFYTRTP